MRWYQLSPDEAATRLEVDPARGLSGAEVDRRREKYGPNVLAAKKKESGCRRSCASTRTSCRSSCWAPPIVNLVVTGEMGTTIVLVGPDGLQRGAGPARRIQGRGQPGGAREDDEEHRPRAPRRRRRSRSTPSELVPGDIVLMEAGNRVPADGRLFVTATLEIEEAALTGESVACAQGHRRRSTSPMSALGDRHLHGLHEHRRSPAGAAR